MTRSGWFTMAADSPVAEAEAAFTALADAIGRYPPAPDAPGVPDALRDELAGSALSRLLLTAELGGLGLAPAQAFVILERAARISGAVGRQLAWHNLNFLLDWLPPVTTARLLGAAAPPVVAGSVWSGGCREVTKDGDDWMIKGLWSSWTDPGRANILLAGFTATTAGGAREPRIAVLAMPQAVPGLRTDRCRSLDGEFVVRVPPVRVPVSDTVRLAGAGPDALILALLAATAIGVAGAAIESFTRLAAKKWRPALQCPLIEDPVVAGQLDTARAEVASARELTLRELSRELSGRPGQTGSQAEGLARAASYAVTVAGRAVGSMFWLAGARAVFLTEDLQRCLADSQITAQLARLSDSRRVPAGPPGEG
jgi:alkylation response protein AidB-like acyl-CoA dehydrogenase